MVIHVESETGMSTPAQPKICDRCGKVVSVRLTILKAATMQITARICEDCYKLWVEEQGAVERAKKANSQ